VKTRQSSFEREFLKLAFCWLKCRNRVINGPKATINDEFPLFDLALCMLGCNDSAQEMKLLCKEVHAGSSLLHGPYRQ
jgi:hypothetical protein